MDGHFVPNISFGPFVVECLRRHVPEVNFDCHMMTTNPEKWVDQVAKSLVPNKPSSVTYTFHLETTEERNITQAVIDDVKAKGMNVGLAISPATDVKLLLQYCDQIHLALIMTVVPGKGGQKFMQEMCEKIRIIRESYPKLDIEVDGGVKPETVDFATKAGANLLVSGSGVFKAKNMKESIEIMRNSVKTNSR